MDIDLIGKTNPISPQVTIQHNKSFLDFIHVRIRQIEQRLQLPTVLRLDRLLLNFELLTFCDALALLEWFPH